VVLVPARRWEETGEMKKGERAGNVHAVNSCTSTDEFWIGKRTLVIHNWCAFLSVLEDP